MPSEIAPTPNARSYHVNLARRLQAKHEEVSSCILVEVRAVSTAQAQRMAENELPGWTAYHAKAAN